jgi:hypothetical protein
MEPNLEPNCGSLGAPQGSKRHSTGVPAGLRWSHYHLAKVRVAGSNPVVRST